MAQLAIVHPYYAAEAVLPLHTREWRRYPDKVRDGLTVILVDDGSPTPLADVLRPPKGLDVRVYRVQDNRPWNQHGARNLGAVVAETGWLLMLDMDKVMPASDMARLWNKTWFPGEWYKFGRGLARPYYNQFMCGRADFLAAGGYCEGYCGTYGGDGVLVKNLGAAVELVEWPDVGLRHLGPGRSTTYDRTEGRRQYLERWAERKAAGTHMKPERMIQFEWERVH